MIDKGDSSLHFVKEATAAIVVKEAATTIVEKETTAAVIAEEARPGGLILKGKQPFKV